NFFDDVLSGAFANVRPPAWNRPPAVALLVNQQHLVVSKNDAAHIYLRGAVTDFSRIELLEEVSRHDWGVVPRDVFRECRVELCGDPPNGFVTVTIVDTFGVGEPAL